MLSISKPLSSGQAQSYHKLEFTADTQSYYKQGGAVEGEWQGELAKTFGLADKPVDAQSFTLLTEGKHPQTEEQMVRVRHATEYTNPDGTTTKAVEHRAGWDATFSAPKSVSLTALVGGDEQVREAHRAAVTTALAELERYTQARIGGNHPGETTGKFIAAKFEHDTARPVDGYAAPQLHTHSVIFNVTERDDGTTRALQPKGIFDSQSFATAVYQSELTFQLRNLGYELTTGKSGAPEIKGYTQEYLDASSLRSQQIREEMEKSGYQGPKAAQIAALATRDSKQQLSPEEVLAAHRELAAAFGNQASRVVADARERVLTQERTPDQLASARDGVGYAKDHNFEREAVADRRGILRDALRHGMGETTLAYVQPEFQKRQSQGEFQQAASRTYDTDRRFTTPEAIAAERANIAHMQRGQGAVAPMMTTEQAKAQAATRDYLNPAQRSVIEEVLTSKDRVHGLQGLAGTGKTTTLEAIKEGAERSGYVVEGFAPTSKAAGQLRAAGINADTLQGFLVRGQHGQADPDSRHLYMLDESSFASTKQMKAFLQKISPQDRVLLVGAGDGADLFMRALEFGHGRASYRVLGLLSLRQGQTGRRIHGQAILGDVGQTAAVLARLRTEGRLPAALVVTQPDLAGPVLADLLAQADAEGVPVRRVPRPTALQSAQGAAALELAPVAIEDLLNRPQVPLDRDGMAALVRGRRVLVTGAGGTIGSELARQCAALAPAELLLLDNGEYALWSIEQELAELHPGGPRRTCIADVRDRIRIGAVFADFRPDLVFHAAALKHVPMGEANPAEDLLTNTLGTRHVADAAQAAGARAMVLISTDKAVNPSSVMGASKRLAEMYCQALDMAAAGREAGQGTGQGGGAMRCVTVRFGNVLGSTGSVVPLFRRQLERGGPLTVTHPDMRRYFMTVREAVGLVLQASVVGVSGAGSAGVGRGGIFVLDMGEPVRIVDLARQMVRLAGLQAAVDGDAPGGAPGEAGDDLAAGVQGRIRIRFTGLRPGEKLYEELFHGSEPPVPTGHPGLLMATPRTADADAVGAAIERIGAFCRAGDDAAALAMLARMVPEFDHVRGDAPVLLPLPSGEGWGEGALQDRVMP